MKGYEWVNALIQGFGDKSVDVLVNLLTMSDIEVPKLSLKEIKEKVHDMSNRIEEDQ